jgi:hypothetical protein
MKNLIIEKQNKSNWEKIGFEFEDLEKAKFFLLKYSFMIPGSYRIRNIETNEIEFTLNKIKRIILFIKCLFLGHDMLFTSNPIGNEWYCKKCGKDLDD